MDTTHISITAEELVRGTSLDFSEYTQLVDVTIKSDQVFDMANLKLPPSVLALRIEAMPLIPAPVPPFVKELSLMSRDDYPEYFKDVGVLCLPDTIKVLDLGGFHLVSADYKLPPNITELSFWGMIFCHENLPTSLRVLKVNAWRIHIGNLPETLEILSANAYKGFIQVGHLKYPKTLKIIDLMGNHINAVCIFMHNLPDLERVCISGPNAKNTIWGGISSRL
jgi:hypothetical protein